MDVVVQEVAKARDGVRRRGAVVVGAEDGVELRVALERLAQAAQRVGMDLDVGVDEDDDLAGRCARRPALRAAAGPLPRRRAHDLDGMRLVRARQRGEAARAAWRVVGGGDDDGQHVRGA